MTKTGTTKTLADVKADMSELYEGPRSSRTANSMTRRPSPQQQAAALEAQTAERNASILFCRTTAANILIASGKASLDGQAGHAAALIEQAKALTLAAETFERGGHRL